MLVTWLGCIALPMTPVKYFGKNIKTSINWPWKRACFSKHVLQALTSRKLEICAELFSPKKPCHEVIFWGSDCWHKRTLMLLMQDLVGHSASIYSTLIDPTYQWNRGIFAPISGSIAHLPGTAQLKVLPHSWFVRFEGYWQSCIWSTRCVSILVTEQRKE